MGMGMGMGNRGLERASRNVAWTFRSAYIWYVVRKFCPHIVGRFRIFPVVRWPLETTPTGTTGTTGNYGESQLKIDLISGQIRYR